MPIDAVCQTSSGSARAGTPFTPASTRAARPSAPMTREPAPALWISKAAWRPPAFAYVDSSVRMRRPMSSGFGVAYVSAPLGHTVVQAPQPTHRCGSTTMPPPVARPFAEASLRIASAEQTSMQARQPICSLRLCAHSFCRYWKNVGFSNSPMLSRSCSTASSIARSSAAWK